MSHNRDELNDIARGIWTTKQFYKTPSCWGSQKYNLTDKQHILINTAIDSFQDIYLNVLDLYKSNDAQGIIQRISKGIDKYFTINRHLNIMGNKGSESSGVIRGLFSIYQLYQEVRIKTEAEKKLAIQAEIKPLLDFLGNNIETATKVFKHFIISLSIRFQFAIELLDNHEEGLVNFAHYLTYMSVQKCSNKLHGGYVQLYKSDDAKITFMTKLLLTHTPENDGWGKRNLKLVGEKSLLDKGFDIDHLLFYSPLESPTPNSLALGFWRYTGEHKEAMHHSMPNQLCSNEELEFKKATYRLFNF